MAIALRGVSQKYHLKQSQKLFGKFKNLHASHFRFANVSITVEIVETENPPQLLLDRPARGLRQRLEEILFCQNQSKLKECQMYVFNSNENTSNLMVPVPPFLNVLNT
jgi:hypothetical protein